MSDQCILLMFLSLHQSYLFKLFYYLDTIFLRVWCVCLQNWNIGKNSIKEAQGKKKKNLRENPLMVTVTVIPEDCFVTKFNISFLSFFFFASFGTLAFFFLSFYHWYRSMEGGMSYSVIMDKFKWKNEQWM